MYRTPNPAGSNENVDRDDTDMLIAEMSYSPAWRAMLTNIVAPRAVDIRRQLLTDASLDERTRHVLMGKLEEYALFLGSVYGTTESGNMPEIVAQLFR